MKLAQIEELELQPGRPIGSTMAILGTLKVGEEKLYSGVDSDTGDFTYITKDSTGKITTRVIQGVGSSAGSSGGSLSIAEQFVADNPNASREELELQLKKSLPKLSDSDINSVLDAAKITSEEIGITEDQYQAIAIGTVKSFGNTEDAIDYINNVGTVEIGGKDITLTNAQRQAIVDQISEEYPEGRTFWQSWLPWGK